MGVIAVDFDGTIRSWKTNEPIEGAREAISWLREKGHTIIIHSCNRKAFIEQWMLDHDIRHDGVWDGKGKPVADRYVDDAAVQFVDWRQTLRCLGV